MYVSVTVLALYAGQNSCSRPCTFNLVGPALIAAQTVFLHQDGLERDELRLLVQHWRQLIHVQFAVTCLTVEPVVPAIDVVVSPH